MTIVSTPEAPLVRDRLRRATMDAHAALDAGMQPLLSAGEDRYVAFLSASAFALLTMEQALAAAGVERLLPDWSARSRSAALLADLDALGASSPGQASPPAISGASFQWGMLYVLEGSRLGAQALARIALAHPSPRVRSATRYLRHGAGEGLWRSFLAKLEAAPDPRLAPAEAVAGADAVFAAFARGLEETRASANGAAQ